MTENWTFWRWLRESRRYMEGEYPWWKFYFLALKKWPEFNRKQKMDA